MDAGPSATRKRSAPIPEEKARVPIPEEKAHSTLYAKKCGSLEAGSRLSRRWSARGVTGPLGKPP